MAGTEPDPRREFWLKDFEHISESYWRNEELGESRLNVFIGVVTAVLGGVGYLAKDGNVASVRDIACGATIGLLALGLLTLFRMVKRNASTDGFLDALRVLRIKLGGEVETKGYAALMKRGVKRSILNGGLKHTVAALNAGIAALLVWFALHGSELSKGGLASVIILSGVAVLALVLQEVVIQQLEEPRSDASNQTR